ncbi:MAG: AAA family ATPase, partial [Thermoplasmata archaeon]
MMKAFVNRAEEMKILTHAFDQANQGHGGFVLIEGEAGLGKSKLVEEFLSYCSSLGAVVISGKCMPGDAEPYKVFTRILKSKESAEDVNERMPVCIMPILGKRRYDFDIKKAREMVFEKLFQTVLELGGGRTLVLFIDDIHLSDTASIHLLFYIARNIRSEKILICAAYRPEELANNQALSDAMQRMRRENLFIKLRLGPLSKEHTKILIEKRIEEDGLNLDAVRIFEYIFEQTNGNPFYIEEMVKLASTDGLGKVPSSVNELLKNRLEKLSKKEIEVISAAAVLGKEFDFNILNDMLKFDEEEALDILDKFVAQYILIEEEFGEELCYKFRQDMLWEVAYSMIPEIE